MIDAASAALQHIVMASHFPITQNPDVRFLGKLLGDVIRAYGGDALFRRIEYIRSVSVDRARGIAGSDAIDTGLDALTLDDTLAFVRGFMLFSMLANLAEDRQGTASEPDADMAQALDRLAKQGIDRAQALALLEHALVVPVLTAHPTEVRRKSMIDHRNRIADLMRTKDSGAAETEDSELVEDAIVRQIALLWETRALRRERLYVADEIDTALAYLRDILLPTLPALYARWDRALGHRTPSFLRLGNWIGGDRDGNPNVGADSLRLVLARSAEAVIGHYLDEIHALGAELSISTELAPASEALSALADAAHDPGRARGDEPYRRALTGIYARLATTFAAIVGHAPPRPARVEGEAYPDPAALRHDLATLAHALAERGGDMLRTDGSLARLIRAIDAFGFHLAALEDR